jgi:hypothetical protein
VCPRFPQCGHNPMCPHCPSSSTTHTLYRGSQPDAYCRIALRTPAVLVAEIKWVNPTSTVFKVGGFVFYSLRFFSSLRALTCQALCPASADWSLCAIASQSSAGAGSRLPSEQIVRWRGPLGFGRIRQEGDCCRFCPCRFALISECTLTTTRSIVSRVMSREITITLVTIVTNLCNAAVKTNHFFKTILVFCTK